MSDWLRTQIENAKKRSAEIPPHRRAVIDQKYERKARSSDEGNPAAQTERGGE